ncbi:MAG: DUF1566 domain-containing protein [Acidobacteria bacterium]|nr:DUF1566 domain-containing protein [Acidobacteriota bacterium]
MRNVGPKLAAFLVLLCAGAYAQHSNWTPDMAQKTHQQGYWIDASTGLMWVAQDSDKRMGWHKAAKYCEKLRTQGYSNWRLPSIEELVSLVNLQAYATEHVGSSDIMRWNGDLHVNGGLLLNGDRHWSSTKLSPNKYSAFDYRVGKTMAGFEDWAEGDTMYALCVRTVQKNQPPNNP